MGSVKPHNDREATFDYCLDMLWQIADLLQRQAGQTALASVIRALVVAQRRVGFMESDGYFANSPLDDGTRSFRAL